MYLFTHLLLLCGYIRYILYIIQHKTEHLECWFLPLFLFSEISMSLPSSSRAFSPPLLLFSSPSPWAQYCLYFCISVSDAWEMYSTYLTKETNAWTQIKNICSIWQIGGRNKAYCTASYFPNKAGCKHIVFHIITFSEFYEFNILCSVVGNYNSASPGELLLFF